MSIEITDEMVERAANTHYLMGGAVVRWEDRSPGAQNLYRIKMRAALTAALSPAPQALAGEGETQTTVGIGRDGKIFWTREGDMRVHAREQAERIERLEAVLAKARERIEMARLLTDTGAVSLGKTMDYSPIAVEAILRHLDTALTVLAEGGRADD